MSDTKAVHSLRFVLSNNFERRVNLYSVAAAAAGVSVLALTTPAEGKVVITKKTISLPIGQSISLDLNHDGISDFQFNFTTTVPCDYSADLTAQPLNAGAVLGGPIGTLNGPYASALVRGAHIGPSAHFAAAGNTVTIERTSGVSCSHASRRDVFGHWGNNPPNRYLGVKFLIHGTTHFGWIRLSANFVNRDALSATITAYAYETIANKRISAGSISSSASEAAVRPGAKPARPSLGMLALGADGLAIWRRKETLSTV